jgi:hypothetical protein
MRAAVDALYVDLGERHASTVGGALRHLASNAKVREILDVAIGFDGASAPHSFVTRFDELAELLTSDGAVVVPGVGCLLHYDGRTRLVSAHASERVSRARLAELFKPPCKEVVFFH